MVKELTKEELLKRVMALEDGAVIDADLRAILMSPSNSKEMIESIKHLNRMVVGGDGKYDHRIRYVDYLPQTRNDLVKAYAESRKNVTNVDNVGFGILPNDLEHPIQEVDGIGWAVRIKDMGGFVRQAGGYRIDNGDDEKIFAQIDKIIKTRGFVHTYIYAIDEGLKLGGGYGFDTTVEVYLIVRLYGLTKNELEWMKNKSDDKDSITWTDRWFAMGGTIDY